MDKITKKNIKEEFVWLPEHGYGYYPVKSFVYDQAYFDKYAGYEGSDVAKKLNDARVDLTNKYAGELLVVDVGVGSGTFLKSRRNTVGFDVNPAGVEWLKDEDLWLNPWEEDVNVCTFWDSLEHIQDPTKLLKRIQGYAIVSLPIFKDVEHVLKSKHFRKDEHYWYFTHQGFIWWMNQHNFSMIEHNQMEVACGREDIGTYVFYKRRK